jgi:thiosulfate/3-mercaptopyruvate sulfurtransferase
MVLSHNGRIVAMIGVCRGPWEPFAPMTDQNLISAAELAARLDDPQLLVVDCRSELADHGWGRRQYDAGHVPGAICASLETELSGPGGPTSGRHPLPQPAAFARTLAAWGVTPATRIVAYDQGHGAYAARLWWLLRASGRARVQVLDGGFAAWTQNEHPLSTTATVRTPAVAGPPRSFDGWLSTAQIEAARGDLLLVDARGADRYAGQNETIDPVAGHVPGALNRPFLRNLGTDGLFLEPSALRAAWTTLLGGTETSRLVSMCGSGVTACHNLLALEQAGLPGARLYAGSWSEWIRDVTRPVATGPTP